MRYTHTHLVNTIPAQLPHSRHFAAKQQRPHFGKSPESRRHQRPLGYELVHRLDSYPPHQVERGNLAAGESGNVEEVGGVDGLIGNAAAGRRQKAWAGAETAVLDAEAEADGLRDMEELGERGREKCQSTCAGGKLDGYGEGWVLYWVETGKITHSSTNNKNVVPS